MLMIKMTKQVSGADLGLKAHKLQLFGQVERKNVNGMMKYLKYAEMEGRVPEGK